MADRITTRAEVEKVLADCRYAINFYEILLDAIDKGEFVIFNEEKKTYCIVKDAHIVIQ